MKRFGLINLLLITALVIPWPQALTQSNDHSAAVTAPAPWGNADYITAAQLKDYLSFIASDELEGRNTPSRGLDLAAKFIATHLSRWGLKPVGDEGTYFQRIALSRSQIDPEKTRFEFNGQSQSFGADFLAAPAPGTASGPLVYAGHGWVIKSKNINAYEGIEVKDKIVIILGSRMPKGISLRDLQSQPGEDWQRPHDYARRAGAKGIIEIPPPAFLSNWERQSRALIERQSLVVEKFHPQNAAPLPTIIASEKLLTALFRGEAQEGAGILKRAAENDPGPSFDLNPDKKVSFTVKVNSERVMTQNVVAVLEGSDPKLKNEYVAIGAHYDHVGNTPDSGCRPAGGDSLCNGADDDGSGTVAVLAIAEAFARGPRPKRSILFVWHAGEEKGLWGSRYVTEYPVVPLDQIITQLNIDMIGRSKQAGDTTPANRDLSGPNEIYVIGSKMMSTELGELSEAVNQSYLKLTFNYKYDDPKDPQRFFYRSDHYNYARKGIPVIFYFSGVHEDYHRPSDHVEKIDFQKMEKVTRTVYATAWRLANAATRPRVDKQLPPELIRN
jgi:Zn-dependent M28 family amino/carboxypeptidase